MPNFLLIFNRRTGERSELREFDEYQEAMRARFAAEREHKLEPDVEVVVLTARSEQELRATHSRYFQSAHGIA
ncbi:MAG TPA: hypothetical protein VL551_26735 [Actinospica sp.]|jgi:hypothetical protein|nr:hypothetical protein [Actinospica sp.]